MAGWGEEVKAKCAGFVNREAGCEKGPLRPDLFVLGLRPLDRCVVRQDEAAVDGARPEERAKTYLQIDISHKATKPPRWGELAVLLRVSVPSCEAIQRFHPPISADSERFQSVKISADVHLCGGSVTSRCMREPVDVRRRQPSEGSPQRAIGQCGCVRYGASCSRREAPAHAAEWDGGRCIAAILRSGDCDPRSI